MLRLCLSDDEYTPRFQHTNTGQIIMIGVTSIDNTNDIKTLFNLNNH